MSSTDLEKRYQKFLETAKEVEGYNKEEALKFLQEAGIADANGNLAPIYR